MTDKRIVLLLVWAMGIGTFAVCLGMPKMPAKHACSLALVTAIDDAVQMLSAEGNDRLATALATAAEAECKEPK